VSVTLQPGVRYDMPAAYGVSAALPVSAGFQTYTATLTFSTESDALVRLMPRWFEPAGDPLLSVTYTRMVGMDWMGGRDYNIVSVGTPAVYTAGPQQVRGRYTLAIWESDCAPILAGRELMGSPKLFGQIPDVDTTAPEFTFSCSEYDALLVEGTLHDLSGLTAEQLAPLTAAGRNSVGLNWKYIPGPDGTPDADYPTALYMSTPYDRGRRGTGSVRFGTPSDAEAPYSGKIARMLAKVPLLELRDALELHASGCALFRDKTRRLDR
jgi:acetoacetate decarboxylase